jgi:hypothetical protein
MLSLGPFASITLGSHYSENLECTKKKMTAIFKGADISSDGIYCSDGKDHLISSAAAGAIACDQCLEGSYSSSMGMCLTQKGFSAMTRHHECVCVFIS